jgi:mercuric ion transport protein
VRIELLFFPGCPHVGDARRALGRALEAIDVELSFGEVDVTAPTTPAHLRDWGSPTILVDGVDVAGGVPSGACCRVYPASEYSGAPPPELIETAVRRALLRRRD